MTNDEIKQALLAMDRAARVQLLQQVSREADLKMQIKRADMVANATEQKMAAQDRAYDHLLGN